MDLNNEDLIPKRHKPYNLTFMFCTVRFKLFEAILFSSSTILQLHKITIYIHFYVHESTRAQQTNARTKAYPCTIKGGERGRGRERRDFREYEEKYR